MATAHASAISSRSRRRSIEAGAKANHLSYIGDAFVGAGANVGAGTITCNYDGSDKHRTEIGKDAFIGSNSALVAPVKIGDGAYIGSGSVITENVPAGALALARGRQVIKEGWRGALARAQIARQKESTFARLSGTFARLAADRCHRTKRFFIWHSARLRFNG